MNDKVKEYISYIIIIIVVILIRTFIIDPVRVDGTSMEDTLKDNEILLLDRISYRFNDIKRYDIVVIKEESRIIKRVIGLPGETIEYKDNILYINGKEVEDNYASNETKDFTLEDLCDCEVIPKGYYLVLGDNRRVSKDSRSYGLISEDIILGKTSIRFWPITKIGKFN